MLLRLSLLAACLAVVLAGCDTSGISAPPDSFDPEVDVLFEGELGYADAVAADARGAESARVGRRPSYGVLLARAEGSGDDLRYRRWVRDLRFPRRLADEAAGEVAFVSYRLYDADSTVLRLANAAIPGGPAEAEARGALLRRLRLAGAIAVDDPSRGGGRRGAAGRAGGLARMGSLARTGGEWCGSVDTGYVPCDDDAVTVVAERPPPNMPPPNTGGGGGSTWDPNDVCSYDPGHPDCAAGGGPGLITIGPPSNDWPGTPPPSRDPEPCQTDDPAVNFLSARWILDALWYDSNHSRGGRLTDQNDRREQSGWLVPDGQGNYGWVRNTRPSGPLTQPVPSGQWPPGTIFVHTHPYYDGEQYYLNVPPGYAREYDRSDPRPADADYLKAAGIERGLVIDANGMFFINQNGRTTRTFAPCGFTPLM